MKHLKIITTLFLVYSLNVTAFSKDLGFTNEYNLKQLKQADAPKEIKVLLTQRKNFEEPVIQNGILFTYFNRKTESVFIAGDFNKWRPEKMTKGKNGVWFHVLYEYDKSEKVSYKYMVNGIWIKDPINPEAEDDHYGSFVSTAYPVFSRENKRTTYRILKERDISYVEFRIYNENASYISVIGDFNNWNPENDVLIKGSDNIWRLKKRLTRGQYRYMFLVDGTWSVDLYNKDSASNDVGKICSLLTIE